MTLEAPAADEKELPDSRPAQLQWNLRTLFLLTAAVAAWLTFFHYRAAVPQLKHQVQLMRQVAPELIVEDSQQIATLKLPQTWRNEHRWDIYLPNGQYVIRLATREIGEQGLAPAVGETSLRGGQHHIELRLSDDKERPRLTVLVDGRLAIDVNEKPDWTGLSGHRWDGGPTFSPEEPVVLFRGEGRTKPGTPVPVGATNGLLLWIERVTPPDSR